MELGWPPVSYLLSRTSPRQLSLRTKLGMSFTCDCVANLQLRGSRRTHWRLIVKHLRLRSGRSQVERVLALIVESGVVYCVIWVRPHICSPYMSHAWAVAQINTTIDLHCRLPALAEPFRVHGRQHAIFLRTYCPSHQQQLY